MRISAIVFSVVMAGSAIASKSFTLTIASDAVSPVATICPSMPPPKQRDFWNFEEEIQPESEIARAWQKKMHKQVDKHFQKQKAMIYGDDLYDNSPDPMWEELRSQLRYKQNSGKYIHRRLPLGYLLPMRH
jgi:hypothetical protein